MVVLVGQLVHMQGLTRLAAQMQEVVAAVVAAAVAAVVAAVVTRRMRMTICPRRLSHFSRHKSAHGV
jgi:hypothetical protein